MSYLRGPRRSPKLHSHHRSLKAMAPSTTVCISSPGSMGAAIAAKFTAAGFTVLCPLSSRSPSSQARAKQAKMENASLREIVKRADWILSILPPSSAIGFAQEIHDAWNEYTAPDPMATPRPLVFVDCNAINLSTVRSIAQLFDREQLGEADAGQKTLLESIRRPVTVLDAGIIGGPPSESYNPTIYASAAPSHAETLALFASLGDKCGLKIKPLRSEGSDIGAASALKMSYAVRTC
jgi:NAD(P)-dependent dehydrogenase (short-subunit alcohol dehydrogenase family)